MLCSHFRRLLCLALIYLAPGVAFGRSVYLNGIDISSAVTQDVKNVDVRIDERGDIFIFAPHYQVNEEDAYTPLSRQKPKTAIPEHKPPAPMTVESAAALSEKMAEEAKSRKEAPSEPEQQEPPARAAEPASESAQPANKPAQ